MSDDKEIGFSITERHIQTILVGLITLGILWVAQSVSASRTDIARLEEKVNNLQTQIVDIKVSANDRYRSGDAAKDFRIRDARLDILEKRIGNLESRVYGD